MGSMFGAEVLKNEYVASNLELQTFQVPIHGALRTMRGILKGGKRAARIVAVCAKKSDMQLIPT